MIALVVCSGGRINLEVDLELDNLDCDILQCPQSHLCVDFGTFDCIHSCCKTTSTQMSVGTRVRKLACSMLVWQQSLLCRLHRLEVDLELGKIGLRHSAVRDSGIFDCIHSNSSCENGFCTNVRRNTGSQAHVQHASSAAELALSTPQAPRAR